MKRISAVLVAGVALSWSAAAIADEGSDRVAAAGNAAMGGSQAAVFRIDQKVWDHSPAADARVAAAGNAAMGGSQAAVFRIDQKVWDDDTAAADARVAAAGNAAMGGSQAALFRIDEAAAARARAKAAALEASPKVAGSTERK